MKDWKVKLTESAFKNSQKLPKSALKPIKAKLKWLENNVNQIPHLPLTGELKGFFKLRMGDYRAIYYIDWEKKLVVVLAVDHRKDIYRKFRK